ncbi:hypothetical protein JRO89_XS01G0400300 [Xanthoceras sorbifolium]|uniref:Nodulin-like domain-containing protein n=1 Tax=Xanthoceras sorbifolium TaxID=99658 RepID=A0ABQ8IPG6_9ROSI|nr:hypothetical protein JRO89_XS01G0400300 [Xanthoceras sorbifolium]
MLVPEKLKRFLDNRWLVFVCAIWVQSFAGVGYVFGSISPVIKSNMGYNQRQICILGVAKDLDEFVGFLAGGLVEVLPIWSIMLIGALQNFVGYGLVWLIVTGRLPTLPLWMGSYCGILKGFAGLTGAILTQIYVIFNAPDDSSLILLLAVGPPMVEIALMFIVRPISGGHKQVRSSDNTNFYFIYAFCLVLAAYLLGVLVVEEAVDVNQSGSTLIAVILIVLLLLPVIIPVVLVFCSKTIYPIEASLVAKLNKRADEEGEEVVLSEIEDEKPPELDSLPALERQKRIAHLQSKLVQAAAQGAVRVNRRKGPRRGEDFTLCQALKKADFWLLFFSFLLAAGSGLTVIDNLGQISLSLGFTNPNIYVSMISIWNFLGRVGGGYFSEIIVRKFAYPRPVAMAVVQVIMAFAFLYYAMDWPGQIYIVTVLIGLGYGAQWAIAPASASELFGLKSFGSLYNFLSMGCPAGSLIFSGVIASGHIRLLCRKTSWHPRAI